ncbi:MAG: FeoB-associated Cys-rich membrane protein [Gemmatimonadota bacterium]
MHITGESFTIVLIVSAALLFTGRRIWRAVQSARSTRSAGCDSGCGCDTAAEPKARDWAES